MVFGGLSWVYPASPWVSKWKTGIILSYPAVFVYYPALFVPFKSLGPSSVQQALIIGAIVSGFVARRKRAGADGGFTVMQLHTGKTAGPRTAEWPNLPGPSWRASALLCLRVCILSPPKIKGLWRAG